MKSTLKRIMSYSKPYAAYMIFAVFCALTGVALSLVVPILTGRAVDLIVGKDDVDFEGIKKIALQLIISILASAALQWLLGLSTNKLAYKTAQAIRCDYFNKLNSVPLKYIDGGSKGDFMSRAVNDTEVISDGLLQGFTQLFTGVVTILGTLVFMISINLKIAIIVVLMTPISFFVAGGIAKASHKAFAKQAQIRGSLSGLAEELISGQKLVKAFGYESRAEERFGVFNVEFGEIGAKATFYSSMTNPSTRFVNGLIYVAVGAFGAFSVINGHFSIGKLASFLAYSSQYTKPFNEISGVLTELQNAVSSAVRVFEVIDEPAEPSDEKLPELKETDGTLSIRDVSFSYNPDRELIKNLDLEVKSGQRIAIVGPTGCGKTTVINLLLRFYDVDSGSISINGSDIREITRSSLRSKYGMVLQETWLFSGTVAENIAYGKPDASMEEIIEAAKAVHAHSFIKRLPNGYETHIDEAGGGLSQGQKQLLCIARIMLTNPPILILDEATSSIDIRTEIRIQHAFEKLMRGKTSFIIAHRLSTIRNADRILVMKNGNIIEQGTHEELLASKGFYSTLYASQFEPVQK